MGGAWNLEVGIAGRRYIDDLFGVDLDTTAFDLEINVDGMFYKISVQLR